MIGRWFVRLGVVALVVPFELEFKSAFACRVRQRFHFALVLKPAAIEHYFVDLFSQCALGDDLADNFSACAIGCGFILSKHVLLGGRRRNQRFARIIIDHLGINVLARKVDRQSRTRGRT